MKRKKIAKIQRHIYRFFDNITDIVIVGILIFMMACGGYAIWDNHILANTASSATWQPYKPKIPGETQSFEELQAMNPDVIGWIDLYGTKIDYPVLYSDIQDKYLSLNPRGEYSLTGSIFLDAHSTPDFTDFNTIIYGHHMEAEAMFGGLDFFKERDYFDEHRYGKLYYEGKEYGLDVLCSFKTNAYDFSVYDTNVQGESNQQQYIDNIISKAIQLRHDPVVEDTGRFLVLSTCSTESTNARTLLLVRVSNAVQEDTFISWPNTGTGVDLEWTIFGIVWYVWLFVIVVLLSAQGLLLLTYYDRRAKKRNSFKRVREALDAPIEADDSDVSHLKDGNVLNFKKQDCDELKQDSG